jgi:Flp pilus assembly pilin Flp
MIERSRSTRQDERGSAALEYMILVGTVGIGSAAAFIALGAAVVRNFQFIRYLLLFPFP